MGMDEICTGVAGFCTGAEGCERFAAVDDGVSVDGCFASSCPVEDGKFDFADLADLGVSLSNGRELADGFAVPLCAADFVAPLVAVIFVVPWVAKGLDVPLIAAGLLEPLVADDLDVPPVAAGFVPAAAAAGLVLPLIIAGFEIPLVEAGLMVEPLGWLLWATVRGTVRLDCCGDFGGAVSACSASSALS